MRDEDTKAVEALSRVNKPLSGGVMEAAAGRQSGRGALLDQARRLRREAEQLEALARAIPDNFPGDADEGLWQLAIRAR